jgi:hypothetical protein
VTSDKRQRPRPLIGHCVGLDEPGRCASQRFALQSRACFPRSNRTVCTVGRQFPSPRRYFLCAKTRLSVSTCFQRKQYDMSFQFVVSDPWPIYYSYSYIYVCLWTPKEKLGRYFGSVCENESLHIIFMSPTKYL